MALVLCTDGEYDDEQDDGDEHHDEGGDGPGQPVHAVAQPHHLHHLLQTTLLLVHNAFNNHGRCVDPGQHHEHGQCARYRHGEAVSDNRSGD